jgi:hypothetical protein
LVVKTQLTVPSSRVSFSSTFSSGRPVRMILLVGQGLARVLPGEKIRIRFADELGRITQAKFPGHGAVHPQKTAGRILEIDGIGKVLHQGRRQCLFVVQRLLRLPALGDVPEDALNADDLTLGVPQRRLDDMDE